MSRAANLLPLLDGVKRTGAGRWIARCPAHDDTHPSLSIREAEDGKLLLKCWSGCTADEIVGAVGLSLADLFPPRDPVPGAGRAPERRPWAAADLIDLAAAEAGIVVVVASDVLHGREISRLDLDRLLVAAGRLIDMQEAARGRR